MNFLQMRVSVLLALNALYKGLQDNVAGKWKQGIEIPTGVSLEMSEEYLGGRNKEMFIAFMRGFSGALKIGRQQRTYSRTRG